MIVVTILNNLPNNVSDLLFHHNTSFDVIKINITYTTSTLFYIGLLLMIANEVDAYLFSNN